MYRDGANQRGIYYQIDRSNQLSIEWLLLDHDGQVTHFIMTYSAKLLGRVNFYYLSAGDKGRNSTIGVQGLNLKGGG